MKLPTRSLKLGIAAVLFALTASTLLAGPLKTGIKGRAVIYISYGTPVEVAPDVWVGVGDLEMPVVTSFTIMTTPLRHQPAKVVGHFTTDANGNFKVLLAPGKYVIVPDDLQHGGAVFGETLTAGSYEITVHGNNLSLTQILYYQDGPITVTADR